MRPLGIPLVQVFGHHPLTLQDHQFYYAWSYPAVIGIGKLVKLGCIVDVRSDIIVLCRFVLHLIRLVIAIVIVILDDLLHRSSSIGLNIAQLLVIEYLLV
jgi:hypothetical protein